MPISPKRMPFFEHIAEMRRRLIIMAVTVGVASIALYGVAWNIYAFIMAPLKPSLNGAVPTVFGPWATFGLRFQVSFYAAIALSAPVIFWQLGAFFLPALKENERKYVVPTFIAAVVLFLMGVAFCYYVILDVGFKWILAQGGSTIAVIPDATLFFNGVGLLMLGFGIGFELPVVVFYLVIFNIVPYAKLRSQWRVVYVLIMVVASVATPDWSPWTMGGLFVSLILLYELSMLLARVVLRKRIAAQKAEELALYGEVDEDDEELAES